MAATDAGEPRRLLNFGGNQAWTARCYEPHSEQDVVAILQHHRDGKVRAFGALHSWSDVAISLDVSLDMRCLDQVQPVTQDGESVVRVGAGCSLQHLLDRLHAATDRTLPTLGAITRQTISGAIATGTHGSGRQSLSHFVSAVRLACYDGAGRPVIRDVSGGAELAAARCGLGCMGVVLSVDVPTVAKYLVEETMRRHRSVQSLLRRYEEWPLTQFILVPYRWTFQAWERRPVAMRARTAGERLKAAVFRLYNRLCVDIVFHLLVKLAIVLGDAAVKPLMRFTPRLLVANVTRIDHAEHVLTLSHHYFRHEEMEIFVRESRLSDALDVLRAAIDAFAGEPTSIPEPIEQALRLRGLHGDLIRHAGTYVHHYPLFCRRILPDDTLISMASGGDEPFFSISVFTYLPPAQRSAYYQLCAWLARCMTALFDARLHWGKHFPLREADIARLYPKLEDFKQLCRTNDPNGVFRNAYTERVLGL